ncbi:hypothetical protein MKL09_00815 [Methylobacterium sp. J-048]|uniref:helix-turn-helix transcriptional regulator n=1 Tax=Methylobacterium sp. J-048 TaxID=2836635 RepID=UPI001FB97D95|nr:hypothetical protein [Methylobacterium sp. J-048]MCJ2055098.1 hypothetical protein [Methylobacterium sp. J-048]
MMQTNAAAKSVILPPDLSRDRVLDSGQTAALLGFSLPHFRRLYRAGQVPQPIRLSTRKLGWKAGTLSDWLAAKERG